LRRVSETEPFFDVIRSTPTRREERAIAPHPSLKPQAFMRQLVRAALPLERGVVLDPFMGAGSTIAAAVAVGYRSIGVELDPDYFEIAQRAIPALAEFGCALASSDDDSGDKNVAVATGARANPHQPRGRLRRAADG
jgi:site-specific DNA-methyltransferase (adenine-specific)